ncbi:MAG: rhomboid family intramembrane serine protease [Flavobacteriales bacterium]|nr:rhomboid family intramembrane serine protease [Flavobacteriales bacterium]
MLNDLKNRYKQASPLYKLIYINVAVFLLVQIVHTSSFLFQNSSIDIISLLGMPSKSLELLFKPWSIITYMFTHSGLMHILFNLMWLYFAGQIFLQYFTAKKLYNIYLLGGITGAATYLIAYNLFPAFAEQDSQLIGASASVLALLFAVAAYVPNYKVNLILLGAIPIKYLAIASVFIDIISIPKGNAGGHIAHLGGAFIGLLFIQQWKKGKDITVSLEKLINQCMGLFRKKKLKTVHKKPQSDDEYRSDKANRSVNIDVILDKISKSGYDSLTDKEKEYLFKNSKKM